MRHRRHHDRTKRAEEEVEPLAITDRRMLGWFYSNLAKNHWYKVLLGVMAMLGSVWLSLQAPLIGKGIFDEVITPRNLEPLKRLALLLLLYEGGSQILGAVRTNVMHLLGQRIMYVLRVQCFSHLVKLGMNYFEGERTGDIMSRISNDVHAVEDMAVHGTDDIITNSVRVLGTVGYMFTLSWKLALVALAPLPIFLTALIVFSRYIRPIFREIREYLGDINVKLQERISGIQVIKAFAREEREKDFFEESSRDYWRANAKSIWMWSTFFPFLGLITSGGMIAMMWYGAHLAATGSYLSSAGTIVAFLWYLQRFYHPIGSLARVYNTLNRALASMARIFQLLDEKPEVEDKEDAVKLDGVEGYVELDDVSFKYPTGETVLDDVSVRAEPGEVVAIVGRSGAGKTTLVNLIARFYDPDEGRVLVDGYDVRDIAQESLRSNIGMVLQETFLFNDTVKENIRYARPDASDEEVMQAAEAAYADEFIKDLEKGYDTEVGERGVKLSVGQKQRIAIARALLVDPRILILDEATSSVDTEAEAIIQQALYDLQKGRTSFVIAHRLSTIRNADKIVVIDEGEVVEQDRHEELMAKGGLYAEMYSRQFDLNGEWGQPSGIGTLGDDERQPPRS